MTRSVESQGWAKAPAFDDDPARRAAIDAHTRRDKAHYLDGGLHEIECRACHACVLVKKTSTSQTSVQWTAAARASCTELRSVAEAGGNPAMTPTCGRLSASIDHGVAEGIIPPHGPTDDPDGYL